MARRFEVQDGRLVQVSGEPETAADRARHADRLQDMLASRQAPRGMTDSVYFGGHHHQNLSSQWGEHEAQRIVADAKRNGFTPGPNDLYNPTLARFPGDPNAFYSQLGGRGELKKKFEAAGVGSENLRVKEREARPVDLDSPIPVAPDIVRSELKIEAKKNPDIKRLSKKKLRDKAASIREQMTM